MPSFCAQHFATAILLLLPLHGQTFTINPQSYAALFLLLLFVFPFFGSRDCAEAAVDSSIACFFSLSLVSALACSTLVFFSVYVLFCVSVLHLLRLWIEDIRFSLWVMCVSVCVYNICILCTLLLLTLAVCRRQCDGMLFQLDSHHIADRHFDNIYVHSSIHSHSNILFHSPCPCYWKSCCCYHSSILFPSIAAAKSTRHITNVYDQACKNLFSIFSLI